MRKIIDFEEFDSMVSEGVPERVEVSCDRCGISQQYDTYLNGEGNLSVAKFSCTEDPIDFVTVRGDWQFDSEIDQRDTQLDLCKDCYVDLFHGDDHSTEDACLKIGGHFYFDPSEDDEREDS